MLSEILVGKMPHETSQTIHPVFYVLLKYLDPACAPACCQVHYILSIHSSKWFFAEASSHSLLEMTDTVERAADPHGGGVELPDWLPAEDR